MNAPEPAFTSITSASRPGGELLGEDRGDDQRDRLDGRGRVAQRVEAAVGGRQVGGLADDRAAGLGDDAAQQLEVGRGPIARDRCRACRASRRCGRARGRRSSAPCRRTRRAPARGSARPCRRRRRWSACRRPGRRPTRSTVPESRIAPVSATRSLSARSRKKTAIANAATWPSESPPSAIPCDEEARSRRRRASRRRACGGSAPAGCRWSEVLQEALDQRAEARGALLGHPQRLLVAQLLAAHALGEVGHRRDRGARAGRRGGRRSPRAPCSCRRGRRRACGTRGSRRASRSSGRPPRGRRRRGARCRARRPRRAAARAARGRRRRAGSGSAGRPRRRSVRSAG